MTGSAPDRRRRWPATVGRVALVFALYLGVAVLVTWPLVTQLDSRLLGHPFSDTTEYTRHIWRIHEELRAGRFDLFAPDPLLLYPDGLSSAWLWTAPLQSFPQVLLLFLMPLSVAHNGVALLTLALNGLAMWGLAWWLLREGLHSPAPLQSGERENVAAGDGDIPRSEEGRPEVRASAGVRAIAAFLAGLVFAFYPAFQGQLGAGHTGLLVLWPMPLYVLCLMRAAESDRRDWRWIAGAAVLFAVSQWGNLLLLLYLVLPFTALYLLSLAWRRKWRGLRRALVAVSLGVVCSLPFLLPTLADASSGAVAREAGVVRYSASLLTVAAPSFYHPLYSGFTFNRTLLGEDPFEGAGYVGLIAAALAVLAVIRVRRARFWLLLALLAWVASLGPLLKLLDAPVALTADGHPSYIALPWALVQNLPLFDLIRTPVRFNFTIGLAMAVLVGYGAWVLGGWLARRRSARLASGALVAVAVLLVLDFQWFWPLPTIEAEIPAAVRALAGDESIRAVFDVPWQHPLTDKDGLLLQTGHGQPMIGGHVTRRTPLDPARGMLLQESLDPYLLNAAGVDVIILHKQWDDDPAVRSAQLTGRFGPPLHEDERIAVWRVTHDASSEPTFVVVNQLSGELTDARSLYVYAPEAASATLRLTLSSPEPRHLRLTLDGQPVEAPFTTASFRGEETFSLPLMLEPGTHTLTLTVEPPCPPEPYPTLACAAVSVQAALDTP